jgi:hypothetical protein
MYNFIKQSKVLFIVAAIIFCGTNAFSQTVTDVDLKKNVQPITSVLNRLIQLKPSTYEFETTKFKHLNLASGKQFGFLTDNVETVFPELIRQKKMSYMFAKNGFRNITYKSVDEASLVPLLVASIKEQQQQIEELKAAIEELKKTK